MPGYISPQTELQSADSSSAKLTMISRNSTWANEQSLHENPSIAMVMPHFGKWPSWFPLFLETCRYNSSIDWHFFTDCPFPEDAPSNVYFYASNLNEIARMIESAIGFPVTLPFAFKICDFRPAFGVIFADLLQRYDWWGWGDTDVIYGDLRYFVTRTLLNSFDVISPRSFLAGEFTLIRNSPRTNLLFQEGHDTVKIFTSPHCYDFEEDGFFKDRPIDSFTDIVKRMSGKRALFRDILRTDKKLRQKPFQFHWHKGCLRDLRTGEQILLYHFLNRKRDLSFRETLTAERYKHSFLISQHGLEPCPSQFTPRRRLLPILFDKTIIALRALRRLFIQKLPAR